MMFYIIFANLLSGMDYFTILVIALGLSFDTFAVSLSYGVIRSGILFREASRIAIVLAAFQGGLTVAGYFLGSIISVALKATDHWIALGLLSFLGIKMIVEGMKKTSNSEPKDYKSTFVLLTIALGTSIDAFAVGISFALLDVRIWEAGTLIGAVTFLASMTAIRIGKSAGARLGNKVEIIGGLLLIAIGLKIFLEHMLAT
jgi:manganese efflux pump family protein